MAANKIKMTSQKVSTNTAAGEPALTNEIAHAGSGDSARRAKGTTKTDDDVVACANANGRSAGTGQAFESLMEQNKQLAAALELANASIGLAADFMQRAAADPGVGKALREWLGVAAETDSEVVAASGSEADAKEAGERFGLAVEEAGRLVDSMTATASCSTASDARRIGEARTLRTRGGGGSGRARHKQLRPTAAAAAAMARSQAAAATRLQAEMRRGLVARSWVGRRLRELQAARARLRIRSAIVRAQQEAHRLHKAGRAVERESKAARQAAQDARQALAAAYAPGHEEQAAESALKARKRLSLRAASALAMLKGAARAHMRRHERRERAATQLQAAWRRGLATRQATQLRQARELLARVQARLAAQQARYVQMQAQETRDEEEREVAMAVTRRLATARSPPRRAERERGHKAMEARERLARRAIEAADGAQRAARALAADRATGAGRIQAWWRARAMTRQVERRTAAVLLQSAARRMAANEQAEERRAERRLSQAVASATEPQWLGDASQHETLRPAATVVDSAAQTEQVSTARMVDLAVQTEPTSTAEAQVQSGETRPLRAEANAFVPAADVRVTEAEEGGDWRQEVRAWMAMELKIGAAMCPQSGVRAQHMAMMLAARRSGGRQRRRERLRKRGACWALDDGARAPAAYVGEEQGTLRFAEAASKRGIAIGEV